MREVSDSFSLSAALLQCWRACVRDPKPSCRSIAFTCVVHTTNITSATCLGRADTAKSHSACDFPHALRALEPVLHPEQIGEALPAQATVWVPTKLIAKISSSMLDVLPV